LLPAPGNKPSGGSELKKAYFAANARRLFDDAYF
jgi:hypothetical protein